MHNDGGHHNTCSITAFWQCSKKLAVLAQIMDFAQVCLEETYTCRLLTSTRDVPHIVWLWKPIMTDPEFSVELKPDTASQPICS